MGCVITVPYIIVKDFLRCGTTISYELLQEKRPEFWKYNDSRTIRRVKRGELIETGECFRTVIHFHRHIN